MGCEGVDRESFESFQGYLSSCLLGFAKSTDNLQYLTQLRLHIKEFEGAWWPSSRGKCDCHCCHQFRDNGEEAIDFITSDKDGRFCKNDPEKTGRYVCFWLLGVRVNTDLLGDRDVDLRRAFNRFWFSEKYVYINFSFIHNPHPPPPSPQVRIWCGHEERTVLKVS